jgi:predicted acetyltransferase
VEYPIRPITPDDYVAFMRTVSVAHGDQPPDEEAELWRPIFELDRAIAAFDGAHIVATAGVLSFEITVPGLTTLPTGGVSFVGVLPTYRRRGLLRALMGYALDDMRARGEPLAILGASESSIYGRFGFGIATQSARLEIESRHGAFARPLAAPGVVALIGREEAARTLPPVYDRAQRCQPGALARSAGMWEVALRDLESWRDGASALFFATYATEPGRVDGYVTYRVARKWEQALPAGSLLIGEVIATTPEAYAALWHYCLNVDLVTSVRTSNSSIDEPLRWLLADPRRLRVTAQVDGLWARPLDVARALSGRRYLTAGYLVLEVADGFCPANAGRYALEGSPDGAHCRRTAEGADLRLDVADLGATYLGGVRFSTLARAGRVVELSPGALARADALFAAEPLPWCATDF